MADDPQSSDDAGKLAPPAGDVQPPRAVSASGQPGDVLEPSDIESLLAQAARSEAPGAANSGSASYATGAGDQIASADIELLLRKAEAALASAEESRDAEVPGVARYRLEDFAGAAPSGEAATLELLRDVELNLKIELGRTHMQLEDVLKLRKGSVVPLDKLAGDPVDIYVNGRLIARGEVLVLNDNFCVRVAELISGDGSS